MGEEKEIKVRILGNHSIYNIKKIIEELFDIKFESVKQDNDTYYDLKDNFYFKLNHVLRIRNDKEVAYKALFLIPEKKPNPWFVLEKEYNLPISKKDLAHLFNIANINHNMDLPNKIDSNKLKELFQKLKFIEKIKIKKTRWSAENENCKICIDSVNNLGLFVEIEVEDDSFLNIFKHKLPFQFKEIRHGYTNLYAKEVLKMKIPNFEENFSNNPDWNFLSGQKQLITQILNNKT